MERLNSGESKTIFRNISCIVITGLTKSGRKAWQEEEEETRKDFSSVLIHQEQSCSSDLFKVIQDAVSLILHYRTMSLFRTVSSSTFTCRMCNQFTFHNQIRIDTLLVDPMEKDHKDLDTNDLEAPRHAQNMHKAWKKHQNTVYWVDIIFSQKKGLKSIRHDRMPSSFMECSHIVSRKLFGWKLEKSYTRKYMRHFSLLRRFP